MLRYSLLKNHAGILLCGDYLTLQALHGVIHDVNEKSLIVRNKEGVFLGLAYDIRKAYESAREVIKPPEHTPEIGIAYGVKLLWPTLLFQCTLLRESFAFFDSTKLQQGLTYELEDVIEQALDSDFGNDARLIVQQWGRLDARHPWAEEKINSRSAQYCAWTKTQRRRGLSGLLMSLDAMYPTLYPIWTRQGDKDLVSPDELDNWNSEEWPDPKW